MIQQFLDIIIKIATSYGYVDSSSFGNFSCVLLVMYKPVSSHLFLLTNNGGIVS